MSSLSKTGALFAGKIFSIIQKCINSLAKFEVPKEVTLFEAFTNILYSRVYWKFEKVISPEVEFIVKTVEFQFGATTLPDLSTTFKIEYKLIGHPKIFLFANLWATFTVI